MWKSIGLKILGWHERHHGLAHTGLIVLVGMIVYSGTLHAPFHFDDLSCIIENPLIRNFSTMLNLKDYQLYGLPEDIRNNMVTRFVAYLTFALNYRLHGLSLPGYHLVNIGIHLVNAILVYQLFSVTIARCTSVPAHDRNGKLLALVAALIFVTHPVQTNAVTYIVQRFSLLATCFYLIAVTTYIKAASCASGSKQRIFYTVACVAAILAMYTKEISFTLPIMIALYDVAFLDGNLRLRVRRLAPILATLALIPVTVMTLSAISANTSGSVGNALDLANLSGHSVSRWDYFITQWRVIVTYLRLLLLPVGLNFDYDYPIFSSIFHWEILLSGFLVCTLSLCGIYLLLRSRGGKACDPDLRLVGFGLVWFFLTLVMESSIIRLDDIIFEYRLYLPTVGFCGAIVALGNWGLKHLPLPLTPFKKTFAAALISATLVVSLGVATVMRNQIWSDAELFWQDASAKSPNKFRPLGNLINGYCSEGRFHEALPLAEKAKRLKPDDCIPPFQLAQIYWQLNQPDKAIAELTLAVRLNATQFPIWLALGYAYVQQNMLQEAADAFQQALILKPGDQDALHELEQLRKQKVFPIDRR